MLKTDLVLVFICVHLKGIFGWIPVPDFVGIGGITGGSFELNWSPVLNATEYEVAYSPFSNPAQFSIVKLDAEKRAYKFTGLSPCTAYFGKVRALARPDMGAWLDIKVETGAGKPLPPQGATFDKTILTIVDAGPRPECGDYTYVMRNYNDKGELVTTQQSRLKSFNFPDLVDKQKYKIKTTVKNLVDGSESDPVEVDGEASGITKLDPPPNDIAITKVTEKSIEFAWTAIPSTKTQINVVQTNSLTLAGPEVESTNAVGVFDNLKDCTKYVAYLRSNSGTNYEVPFTTLPNEAALKPVITVVAHRVYPNDAHLKIENKAKEASCVKMGYKIDVSHEGISIMQKIIQNSDIMLTNLIQESKYTCIVTPIILHTLKEFPDQAMSVDFTTPKEKEKYDLSVLGLKANTVLKRHAVISWIPPTPTPDAYSVSLVYTNMNAEYFVTEETGFLLNNLLPCSHYVITVRPIVIGSNPNVGLAGNELKILTALPEVTPPVSVSLTKLSDTELNYEINDPSEDSCGSRKYHYTLYDDLIKDRIVENIIYTKKGKIPFKSYPTKVIMKVYAFVNDPKNRSPSVDSNSLVFDGVALEQISGLKLDYVETNSFKVTWNNVPTATNYIVALLKNGMVINKETVATNQQTFLGLDKCQKYNVLVRATDMKTSYSDVASLKDVETLETIPLPVESATVFAISESSIYLIIRDYAIPRCSKPSFEVKVFNIGETDPISIIDLDQQETVITGLTPEEEYFVKVSVKGKSFGFISNEVVSNVVTTLGAGLKEKLPEKNYTYKPEYFVKFPLLSPDGASFMPKKESIFSSSSQIEYSKTIENFLTNGKLDVLKCDLIKMDSGSTLTARLRFGSDNNYITLGRVQYATYRGMKTFLNDEIKDFGFKVDYKNMIMSRDLV